ncbi:MAG TPA: tripartite tricarboxylate transporter substrate binding protein, partial [Steroidobacter sp.]|nr:tripartite tricarboxylate transporter substrate binding protein [Steroidobacter sp.]
VVIALCALALLAAPTQAAQIDYPRQPIRMIVPFAAGGTADLIARILAARMSAELGQQVVVESIDGAGGTLGSETVARARADGYTILINTAPSFAINPVLYPRLTYDIRSFAPVALMTRTPNVMVARKDLPANTLAEFVALAKREPGRFTYGSSGNGTVLHLSGVLLARDAGIEIRHIPYRGGAPAMNDLIGGVIDVMFDNLPASLPQIRAGNVKALAVTTKMRSPVLHDLPTMAEQGFPDFETDTWSAIFAPPGTPAEIVGRLNEAALATARDVETVRRLQAVGAESIGSSPQELAAFRDRQLVYWAPIVRASGARIE